MIVQYGGIVSVASGRLGGTIFSKHKGAPVVRCAPAMGDRDSSAQLDQRARMQRAMVAWQGLSAYQRLAWNLYGSRNPRMNRIGVVRRLSGIQFFCKEAAIRYRCGLGTPTTPPGLGQTGIGTPTELGFTEGGPYTVSFSSPTLSPHGYYLFAGSRPVSTVSYRRPFWHQLPPRYIEDWGSFDLYNDWTALMGSMATGEVFMIQVRYLGTNCLCSAAATYRSTVAAP